MAVESARDPQHAFGREIEVEVEYRRGLAPGSRAERFQQADELRLDLGRRVAVEPVPLEAGHQDLRLVPGDDDVRLERAVTARDDLAAERGDVVVRRELRRARHLPRARPRGAAV